MTTPVDRPAILVRFKDADTMELTNNESLQRLGQISDTVISEAMGTIQAMASRMSTMLKQSKLSDRPSHAEITFGIELDNHDGALIAVNHVDTTIAVTLQWERHVADSVRSHHHEEGYAHAQNP